MRRILWLILFAVAVPRALHPQDLPASPADRMREDLAAIASFYPRLEGSPGEKALLGYIEARLASLGLEGKPFDFSESDTGHSFSSCLRVDVPGARRDTVILAVPLNHPPDAPPRRDGSVNVALALELLRQARGSPLPVSLAVLFLGAEFGDTDGYPMGSALFLRDFQPDYRAAVISLNLRAPPSRAVVRAGGRGVVSPSWLMTRCVEALRAARLPFLVRGEENPVFRLGLTEERTLIEPFLAAGFPAIGLEGEDGEDGEVDGSLAGLAAFTQAFLAASDSGIPDEWDRHYLLFQVGEAPFVVSEQAYVTILIGSLSGMLLYSLAFRRGLRKYVRSLARNFPRVIPIVCLTFVFLLAGTLAVEGLLALRRFPRFWEYAPLEFLGLKVAIPLLLYSALYNLLRKLPFPRSGTFYTASALFFLLLDIVVVAAFDISFTWYFLLAFLFLFLSALVPNRVGKLLLILPAPYAMVRGLVAIFLMPALPFCRLVLLSPLWGNLLIAGICLPFVLALLRIGLLFPGAGLLRRGLREPLIAGVLLLGAGLLATRLLLYSPFSAANPRPVSVVQSIDEPAGTNILEFESPAPLGEISLSDESGSRLLRGLGSELREPLAERPALIALETVSSEFLGKTNVSALIRSGGSPRVLSAVLTSEEDFILFDCSFPFVRESAREYRLLIGAFPPDPLPLQLTFLSGMSFTLTLTMEFDAPLLGATVAAPGAKIATRLRFVKSFPLAS
ncbi:MAG: hypothetical protein NT005_04930 [Spirochaetes bacterium]|nr:hypothetical protein [Spirochaetota bacterium]